MHSVQWAWSAGRSEISASECRRMVIVGQLMAGQARSARYRNNSPLVYVAESGAFTAGGFLPGLSARLCAPCVVTVCHILVLTGHVVASLSWSRMSVHAAFVRVAAVIRSCHFALSLTPDHAEPPAFVV